MKSIVRAILILIVLGIVGLFIFLFTFNLSALPQPTAYETAMAARAKAWFIGRATAKAFIPPIPSGVKASDAEMNYSMECESCHGKDGLAQTDAAKGMYPRAVALDSPEAQRWSDPELFWIIQNGIRFSGMPGFGKELKNDEIWDLVLYVRQFNPQPAKSIR